METNLPKIAHLERARIDKIAKSLKKDHFFDDQEIAALDLADGDLDEIEELFGKYPNLPKLLKFVNQRVAPKDRYRICNIGEFITLAEECEGSKRLNSKFLWDAYAFADSVASSVSGSTRESDFSSFDADFLSDISEEGSDASDLDSEVAAINFAARNQKNVCAKRRCAANEPARKPEEFAALMPSEAVEKPYFDSFNNKVKGELKKDTLSNHTTKIAVMERNLGKYFEREIRAAAARDVGGAGRR